MRTIISILAVIALMVGMTSSTKVVYPKASNASFKDGEWLRYRVSYGIIDAGEAILTVNKTNRKGAGNRPLYHVRGEGKTLGAFNWFFKVRDVYESYIDQEGVFPWYFVRDVNEGGYEIDQKYTFHQDKQKVINTEGKSFDIPLGAQDFISAFYYARTLDYDNMKIGDLTTINCFIDDEVWPLKIKYMGKEEISIRKGKFQTMKFLPIVQKGDYFKNEDDVEIWITDDENHIPVMVKAKIPVGRVKLHLVEWKGLMGNLAKK